MEASTELFVKFLNIWYFNQPPEYHISNGIKNIAIRLIQTFRYGDDRILSHPKINEIIILLKDYGIIDDYNKSAKDLYFEGKMRLQIEIRDKFNFPEVLMTMDALTNILGKMTKVFAEEAQKQINKEKNISAIPELSQKHIFEN